MDDDRLQSPNTYFYTAIDKCNRFDAWLMQRLSVLRRIDAVSPMISGVSDFVCRAESPIDTNTLTATLWKKFESGENTDLEKGDLNLLLQKFEVSKRLFGQYDSEWCKIEASGFVEIDTYIYFGQSLCRAYGQGMGLNYLNGLLKLNDTLISVCVDMNSKQVSALGWLVAREVEFVSGIYYQNLSSQNG